VFGRVRVSRVRDRQRRAVPKGGTAWFAALERLCRRRRVGQGVRGLVKSLERSWPRARGSDFGIPRGWASPWESDTVRERVRQYE
jgi:hypothetical protein